MKKVTLTILLAVGIMAFKKPATPFETNSHVITFHALDDFAMNLNAATSEKNLAFFQKDKEKGKGNNGNKGNNRNNAAKNDKQPFEKKDNGNHNSVKQVSKKVHNGNKHAYGNNGNGNPKKYKKGHPNFNYVFVNNHGYYSHKNFGQWRSEQARMKHQKYHPLYELEAIEGFRLLHSRNVFLFDETDYKINLLRQRLAERRRLNQINEAEYARYNTRIAALEDRRALLNINISL